MVSELLNETKQRGKTGPKTIVVVWKSLEQAMSDAGIEGPELAPQVDVIPWTIYAWLTGRRYPNRTNIYKLAVALARSEDPDRIEDLRVKLDRDAPRKPGA